MNTKKLVNVLALSAVLFGTPIWGQSSDLSNLKIEDKFNSLEINKENISKFINECMPNVHPNVIKQISEALPFAANSSTTLTSFRAKQYFVGSGSIGVCISLSEAGWPILPVEAFNNTVNPVGLPSEEAKPIYVQLARSIALKGEATVAYVLNDGDGYVVTYKIVKTNENAATDAINYSLSIKRAGDWNPKDYLIRVSHPLMTPSLNGIYANKTRKVFGESPSLEAK